MSRTHTTIIATVVGAAVAIGGVALSGSIGGSSADGHGKIAVGALSSRSAQLDKLESDLNRRLASAPTAPTPVTTYVRQAPNTRTVRSDELGEDRYEHESEQADD